MTTSSDAVWLPSGDESIGPVTILDAQGRPLRVVSAEEFRRARPKAKPGEVVSVMNSSPKMAVAPR
jgi:hypothetical protein